MHWLLAWVAHWRESELRWVMFWWVVGVVWFARGYIARETSTAETKPNMRNNFIDTLQPVSNMRCPPGLPAPIDDPTLAVDTDMVDTVQMLLGTELLRAIDEPVERKSTNIAAERLILSQDDKDESEDEAKSEHIIRPLFDSMLMFR